MQTVTTIGLDIAESVYHTWHKTDAQTAPMNVRFEGNTDNADVRLCLLMIQSGHLRKPLIAALDL